MYDDEIRYSDVVGAAIDVSVEPTRFDDLLHVASSFFFNRAGANRSEYGQADPILERRSLQIAKLLEDDLELRSHTPPQPFHAQLEIDRGSLVVTGNSAARQLTNCAFPCDLDDLPLDHDTRTVLRESFLKPGDIQVADKIILTTIEEPTVRSCLALIQRPNDPQEKVVLSISYIEWSKDLLGRLRDAFGLTRSEAEVLSGHLQHRPRSEIAKQRGTTEETVKAQSKAILKKTGSKRMTDVVQLSASIAYLLQSYPDPVIETGLDSWQTPKDAMLTLKRPGGRQLAYYRYGSGAKCVLFVHGFIQGPFFSSMFLNQVEQHGFSFYCPSRPSFGYTSASPSRATHNELVISDTLVLVATEQLDDITIVTHQGGVSHAFRIAAALGSKVRNMVMIDAGIPIDEERHLHNMDRLTRLAGAATKHAPSMMAMMMNLGIPIYKKRGIRAFLENYLKGSPLDLTALDDPGILSLCASGCFHNVQQGSEAWVRDGAAAMADWKHDFDTVTCPQLWLHPDSCPIMQLNFVEDFLSENPGPRLQVIENAGMTVLYQYPALVFDVIQQSRRM